MLFLGILLLLATYSTRLASRFGIPGLIVFLGLGMLFGSDGLNLVYFDDPILAQKIAEAALLIILFEGGFTTSRSLFQMTVGPASFLATVGIVLTAVILGFLSHLVLGVDLKIAMLIGAITSSTDAAAVFAIMRAKKLSPKTAATLEIESASNDPMAIILTVAIIALIQGDITTPASFVATLTWQILIGAVIGVIIGKIGPILFNRAKLEASAFYYVLILGLAALTFGLAELIKGNGFIAVFVAGYFIGNAEFVYKQGISRFLEGVSTFVHVVLFLMLGLLVFPSQLIYSWKEGVVIALLLMFIARPLTVFLSTVFWDFTLKEKLFLCWGGVKGAVPIVLATYPTVAGLEVGHFIFNTVFFVVLLSTLIQGSSLYWVANKLGLLIGERQTKSYYLELIATEKTDYALLEYEIREDSYLVGSKLGKLAFPANSLITAIVRNNSIIAPRGGTAIQGGDTLFILVKHEDQNHLLEKLDADKDSFAPDTLS